MLHLQIKESESVRQSVNLFDNEVIYEASEPLENGDVATEDQSPK